ncbi:MAG: WD40 repeat domain-containing protein [Acidobacteriota bacterium]
MPTSQRRIATGCAPTAIHFTRDHQHIAARCPDGKLQIYALSSGKMTSERAFPSTALLLAADFLYDNGQIWDLSANRHTQLASSLPRSGAALSPDRRFLATSNPSERTVRLWDLSTGKQSHTLPDGIGGAARLAFSPDGETVVSANYDNDIRIWRTRSGELVRKIDDLTGAMFAATFTPDGRALITAGLDETVYVWNTRNFTLERKLEGQGPTIASLAISPDSRTLITGGFDVLTLKNPVRIVVWDFASGRITDTLNAPHRAVQLTFSPDGKWAAFLTGEKEISLLGFA